MRVSSNESSRTSAPKAEGDGVREGGREGQVSDWQSVKGAGAQKYEADKQWGF